MPEITLASIVVTMGLNLLALCLFAHQLSVLPKPRQTEGKKRIPVKTLAYMIIGSNMFIYAYTWRNFITHYVTMNNLPLSLSLGVIGGCLLALWVKNQLQWRLQYCTESNSLLKYNADWHQLYLLQAVTIVGGLLMIITIQATLSMYLLSLIAGGLACCIHMTNRSIPPLLFQFTYWSLWMLVCCFILDSVSVFIAIAISYTLIRVLLVRQIIKPACTSQVKNVHENRK